MKMTIDEPTYLQSAALNQLARSSLRRGVFLLLTLLSAVLSTSARADALTGYYTAISASDPNFGLPINIVQPGCVQTQLGPDGLPVLTAAGVARLGNSYDMNAAHELLYWSPGLDPYVSYDSIPVQVDSMPMNFGYPNPWYVTGQTSDTSYYRAVHWTGVFSLGLAGPVSFNMSCDDDAWLFVDGSLVAESHYDTANPTVTFSAGTHQIDIFYDDRFPVNDSFALTSSVPLSPVPEPGAITLVAVGALCLLVRAKRGQRQVARS